MNRMHLITILTVVALVSGTVSAGAQAPTIRVYFDEDMTMMSMDCPPGGGLQTLYLSAQGFSAYITGVQFQICLLYTSDAADE